MSCVFCLINEGKIPSKKIYEDDKVIAILDISQATYGHTLVLPKEHYENICEIPTDLYLHLMKVVQMLAIQIKAKLHAPGINIINNCGEVAGQSVMHFHVHIIPRYPNDNFKMVMTDNSKDIDLNEVYNKLK